MKHTRLDDISRGIFSWTLASIPGRTTSGELCHRGPWPAHTIRRCLPMLSSPSGSINGRTTSVIKCHHFHLDNTYGRATLSVACNFLPWNEHTIGGYRASHSIIAIAHHKQDQTMLGVACHHLSWTTYYIRQCHACHAIIALGKHPQ